VLAEFGTGQVLWSMVWFLFFFLYIWIVITILFDIFRDHEMSGGWKAVWIICLLFFPLVTAIVYLIVRGGSMTERSMKHAQREKVAVDQYIRENATSATGPAEQIATAHSLLEKGAISQEEFDRLKAKALA